MLTDKYVTISQFARLTGYNVHHIRRLLIKGKLKGEKIGAYWLVSRSQLTKLKRKPNKTEKDDSDAR